MDEENKKKEPVQGITDGVFYACVFVAGVFLQFMTKGTLFGSETRSGIIPFLCGLVELAIGSFVALLLIGIVEALYWKIGKNMKSVPRAILLIAIAVLFTWAISGLF